MIKAVLFIVKLFTYISSYNSEENKKRRKIRKTAKGCLRALENYSMPQTITNFYLKVIAESIFETIYSCDYDVQTIFDLFDVLRNDADIYALIYAYGVKRAKTWLGEYSESMTDTIEESLSKQDIEKINRMLSDKKIAFQFSKQ